MHGSLELASPNPTLALSRGLGVGGGWRGASSPGGDNRQPQERQTGEVTITPPRF